MIQDIFDQSLFKAPSEISQLYIRENLATSKRTNCLGILCTVRSETSSPRHLLFLLFQYIYVQLDVGFIFQSILPTPMSSSESVSIKQEPQPSVQPSSTNFTSSSNAGNQPSFSMVIMATGSVVSE